MLDGTTAVDAGVLPVGTTSATRLVSGAATADAFAVTVERPAGTRLAIGFATCAQGIAGTSAGRLAAC
jgi:hypothetical protein